MRFVARFVLIAAIVVAGYYVYQRPEIQELFRKSTKKGDPLAFLENLPEINPKPRPKRPVGRKPSPQLTEVAHDSASEELEPTREFQNQVPNNQLRRVLMQILAAKKLVGGISLSVTDDKVTVVGEVATAEQKEQILNIVDRGREARLIDGRHLKVRETEH